MCVGGGGGGGGGGSHVNTLLEFGFEWSMGLLPYNNIIIIIIIQEMAVAIWCVWCDNY